MSRSAMRSHEERSLPPRRAGRLPLVARDDTGVNGERRAKHDCRARHAVPLRKTTDRGDFLRCGVIPFAGDDGEVFVLQGDADFVIHAT